MILRNVFANFLLKNGFIIDYIAKFTPINQLLLLRSLLRPRTIQAVLKLIVADIDKIQAEQKLKY